MYLDRKGKAVDNKDPDGHFVSGEKDLPSLIIEGGCKQEWDKFLQARRKISKGLREI